MPIKRTDLEETDEQRTEREEADRLEREAAEKARQEEMDNLRESKRLADLEAATAKGEAEALRRGSSQQAAPAWTDEQWEAEGQKRGMTGQAYRSMAELAGGISEFKSKQLQEEIAEAKREAKEAREETARLKSRKSLDSIESDFYDKNPALKAHRKDVEEFLSSYPDADNVSGDALKKRLTLASNFVKGKVKETMRTNKKGEDGSSRFEESEQETRDGDIGEFDPKGTGNEGAAQLMRKVHSNFGGNLKHEDSVEVWKKCQDDEGRGVSIGIEEDIAMAREISKRGIIGGKRGAI